MKKTLALVLTLVMVFTLAACTTNNPPANNTTTPPSDNTTTTPPADNTTTTPPATGGAKPTINILSMSSSETIVNVVRDQLSKNGFDVTINLQPDYASYKSLVDAGTFDLAISGWTTVTGNPDYAVRSLMVTGADYNMGGIDDETVNELVNRASTETPEVYINTYGELERHIVEEKAYFMPLYRGIKTQGVNTEVLDLSTVRISQARSMVWEKISFNDTARNATDPVVLAQALGDLTSLDPPKGNDGSINQLNSNMYIRLVNLTDDDKVIPDGSLSYNYAIKEGNEEYYFVLRDDVNFAKVENKESVDTGVRVGAEDVVYSLNRARDKDSLPNHKTYSLHESMEEITIVTDLAELDATTASGQSLLEVLQTGAPSGITALTDDKTQVNNAGGTYQVVRVKTNRPFPQVLNYLAHQSAGIVCAEQVESINSLYGDAASYDPTKHVAYGDQTAVMEGPTYDNHLWCSGPYIMIQKNDYQADFMSNPGYMPGTEYEPKIKNYVMRFIADQNAQVSALRAGEIYVLYSILESSVDIVKNEPNLTVQECPSNAVTYGFFNLANMPDENLRKAAVSAINQDEIIAVFDNRVFRAYSTLAPFIDAGNVLEYSADKVAEYLAAAGY